VAEFKELKRRLESLKPFLEENYGVSKIGIFGSFVRGEEREESDLDLLVSFKRTPTLFELIRLEDYLSSKLGVKVDLVLESTLKPKIRERVFSEVVYL
jgi:predicted nucleotidyltransferase